MWFLFTCIIESKRRVKSNFDLINISLSRNNQLEPLVTNTKCPILGVVKQVSHTRTNNKGPTLLQILGLIQGVLKQMCQSQQCIQLNFSKFTDGLLFQ